VVVERRRLAAVAVVLGKRRVSIQELAGRLNHWQPSMTTAHTVPDGGEIRCRIPR
jgi:hypothetical protein